MSETKLPDFYTTLAKELTEHGRPHSHVEACAAFIAAAYSKVLPATETFLIMRHMP